MKIGNGITWLEFVVERGNWLIRLGGFGIGGNRCEGIRSRKWYWRGNKYVTYKSRISF